jgi:hypothetical protein
LLNLAKKKFGIKKMKKALVPGTHLKVYKKLDLFSRVPSHREPPARTSLQHHPLDANYD